MGGHAKQNQPRGGPARRPTRTPHPRRAGGARRATGGGHSAPPHEASATRLDRRAVRTVDLTEEDIAAIKVSEITPGFEHLDAELEPEPASLVEQGVRFGRELGQRGGKTEGRPADKAFRDSLFDDS